MAAVNDEFDRMNAAIATPESLAEAVRRAVSNDPLVHYLWRVGEERDWTEKCILQSMVVCLSLSLEQARHALTLRPSPIIIHAPSPDDRHNGNKET